MSTYACVLTPEEPSEFIETGGGVGEKKGFFFFLKSFASAAVRFFFSLLLLQEFEEGSKEGRKDGNKSVFVPRVVMFVR